VSTEFLPARLNSSTSGGISPSQPLLPVKKIQLDFSFLQSATFHHRSSLRSMSDHSAPSPRDDASEPATPRTSRPSLNYEFIDSQDPNSKSQIQRHTAYHAVQQRREAARQRLLGGGPTPRVFQWLRRPDAEDTSTTTSSSVASSFPAPPPTEPLKAAAPTNPSSLSGEEIQKHDLRSSTDQKPSQVTMPHNDVEEALLKYCKLPSCCFRELWRFVLTSLFLRRHRPVLEKKPCSLFRATL
jgi:hypothetical protein